MTNEEHARECSVAVFQLMAERQRNNKAWTGEEVNALILSTLTAVTEPLQREIAALKQDDVWCHCPSDSNATVRGYRCSDCGNFIADLVIEGNRLLGDKIAALRAELDEARVIMKQVQTCNKYHEFVEATNDIEAYFLASRGERKEAGDGK